MNNCVIIIIIKLFFLIPVTMYGTCVMYVRNYNLFPLSSFFMTIHVLLPRTLSHTWMESELDGENEGDVYVSCYVG